MIPPPRLVAADSDFDADCCCCARPLLWCPQLCTVQPSQAAKSMIKPNRMAEQAAFMFNRIGVGPNTRSVTQDKHAQAAQHRDDDHRRVRQSPVSPLLCACVVLLFSVAIMAHPTEKSHTLLLIRPTGSVWYDGPRADRRSPRP